LLFNKIPTRLNYGFYYGTIYGIRIPYEVENKQLVYSFYLAYRKTINYYSSWFYVMRGQLRLTVYCLPFFIENRSLLMAFTSDSMVLGLQTIDFPKRKKPLRRIDEALYNALKEVGFPDSLTRGESNDVSGDRW